MLFLGYWFVFFALCSFPIYWAARWRWLRLLVLLAGSAVFHTHFAGPAGVLPVVALAALTYVIGLWGNRHACYLGIAVCAGSLVFYKYTRFLCLHVAAGLFPEWGESWL